MVRLLDVFRARPCAKSPAPSKSVRVLTTEQSLPYTISLSLALHLDLDPPSPPLVPLSPRPADEIAHPGPLWASLPRSAAHRLRSALLPAPHAQERIYQDSQHVCHACWRCQRAGGRRKDCRAFRRTRTSSSDTLD